MSTVSLILIGVAIVAIAVAAWMLLEKRKTQRLRSKFGPEYDRMVEESGRRPAETTLDERAKRVEKLPIHTLKNDEREQFAERWRQEQAKFVDDPRLAVEGADRLVIEVMRARGYPMGEFEQRAADISVDHPRVVENYRMAHEIAVRDSRSKVTTEDLRRAMMYYRALFEDLLEQHVMAHEEVRK
jgi:FtsZ-interacting cell division protein ZipA